jgi:flagellar protein FliL
METEKEKEKEKENKEVVENKETEIPKKKSFSINPKIFIIGLPLFIVQLVAVYFITANILLSKVHGSSTNVTEQTNTEKKENKKEQQVELGKFIFSIEDIIVNPAGTEGKRLLLASIGLDITSEEEQQILKSKEILIKDVIISSLSSKSMEQLSNNAYKDTLKNEIASRLTNSIPNIKLNSVYLSKFIIQ